ncbi:hypothetical protein CBW57_02960 [Yersinia intermedia]|uniref:Uncharacterized protein n=1 Tax=Yersinia intermedia TaxID=631 RepID=A0A209AAI8_YERIN|nr:hypothetical protein CBW57_02960 [Yersinia intermedia]
MGVIIKEFHGIDKSERTAQARQNPFQRCFNTSFNKFIPSQGPPDNICWHKRGQRVKPLIQTFA